MVVLFPKNEMDVMGHVNFNYFFFFKENNVKYRGGKLLKLRSHKEIAKINYRYQCMYMETHLSMKGKIL